MPEKLLTVPEAAERLGLGVPTVRRLIAHGELPVVRPTGARAVRVIEADIDRYIGGLREAAVAGGPA